MRHGGQCVMIFGMIMKPLLCVDKLDSQDRVRLYNGAHDYNGY